MVLYTGTLKLRTHLDYAGLLDLPNDERHVTFVTSTTFSRRADFHPHIARNLLRFIRFYRPLARTSGPHAARPPESPAAFDPPVLRLSTISTGSKIRAPDSVNLSDL